MDFKGQRALVTGGSEGIGRAVAEALRERGARVAVMARRAEVLEAAAREMGALAVPGDVAREADAKRAVSRTVAEFGGLDILVNNAGIGYFAPLPEIEPDRFRQVLDVNLIGAMLMAREAAPHFIRQSSGTLINISSTAGLKGAARGSAYVASKFALKGLTECWRDELRRHNVRVLLVNPSEVQTGFGGKPSAESNPRKLRSRDVAAAILGALEMDARGFIPEFSIWATNPF